MAKTSRTKYAQPILAIILSTLTWFAAPLPAQTVPAKATHDDIIDWLESGEPRMVAWGAYFAIKNNDQAAVPELARLAEAWQPLSPQEFDAAGNYIPPTAQQRFESDAMQGVLDALIQLHATMTTQAVQAIQADFPAQAMTLFAFMPAPERTELAQGIYATRRPAGSVYDGHEFAHDWMVHLAAALLAQNPPAGFTASLLNESTVVLKLNVTDETMVSGFGTGAGCGDSLGSVLMRGWPARWTYVVEEQWRPKTGDGAFVLAPGDPAITSRRALSDSSCSTLSWFSSAVRLRLAEQAAGIEQGNKLNVGALQFDNLVYPGLRDYTHELGLVIAQHNEPFHELAQLLASKGLMTHEEAATAAPTLLVEIDDERADKSQPLPHPTSNDPKITFPIGDIPNSPLSQSNPY